MPKPRIRKTKPMYRRATDHRSLVLNVAATTPAAATRAAVQDEVVREAAKVGNFEFHLNAVSAMVSELLREGLLGTRDDGTLFVTQYGLDWLQNADFTRALPAPHTKPGRKKRS